MTVGFTNRLDEKYTAFYTLKPEDIGATPQDTLAALADGLAAALAAAVSEGGKAFSDDYDAIANSVAPGSLVVQALSSDGDLGTAPAGALAASRLVPLSVNVSGPLRVVAPED